MRDPSREYQKINEENALLKQRIKELEELDSERKRAEKELHSTNVTLQAIINASPLAIFALDRDLKVTYWSPAAERIFGWSSDETIGRYNPIVPADRKVEFEALVSQVFSGIAYSGSEVWRQTRDGRRLFVSISAAPLRDAEGSVVGAMGLIQDITDRRLAEEKLRESERKYHELHDFLPIPIYEMDMEGNITSVNRAVYETFGGTEEDLEKGFSIWRIIPPEEADKSRRNMQRLLQGEKIQGTEYNLKRLDGSSFPAIVISGVIHRGGKPVGFRGAIVDITERRRHEEELHRMNVFLDSVVENIPDMIFLKDAAELRFIRFNRAGEELLGYSRDELLGRNDYDFFPEQQAAFFTEKDREVLRGRSVLDIPEEPILTRSKGKRILHTKKVPIMDMNGQPEYLLGISEDITERRRAEEERENLIVELQKALSQVKKLSGLIPICASCKKIRDDKGYWNRIESYIKEHSEAEFSHGICPECAQKFYSE